MPSHEIKLNTGATIPQIGLGTWRSTDDEEAYNAVVSAVKDAGYLHIDTAAIYGNEVAVGKGIKKAIEFLGGRDKIFVTTKLWGTQQREPKKALQQSLERLGLDYVDLYLIHWPVALKTRNCPNGDLMSIPTNPENPGVRDVDLEGWDFTKTWALMQELPATGMTKAIGVSNFSVNNLKTLYKSPDFKIPPAVNQVECHPLLPQFELLDFCRENNIVLEAYSPLGSAGSPLLKEEVIIELGKKYNVEPAQVCISWGVNRGYVVLPKSVHAERIKSNKVIVEMSKEDIAKIDNIHKTQGIQRFVNPPFEPFPIFE